MALGRGVIFVMQLRGRVDLKIRRCPEGLIHPTSPSTDLFIAKTSHRYEV